MRKRLCVVAVVCICNTVPGLGQSSPSIQGVWRILEQTINERTLTGEKLGAGFHIYTARHFAVIRETGEPPRPVLADAYSATGPQLLATWGPFVAQLGTYELSSDRMTETILVSKEPANMTGKPSVRRFRIEGNTLITEPLEKKPGARQITLKLIRVE